MSRRFTAALAFACLAALPAAAAPACQTLSESRADAVKLAAKLGAGYVELDGDKAHALLDRVNAIGTQTHYQADHVGVMMIPSKGAGMVVLADKPCRGSMGYGKAIIMPLTPLMQAYAVVRDGSVEKPKKGGI